MRKKLKYIIVPLIMFFVLQILFLSTFWQNLENKSRDLFFILRGEQEISGDVVIVEIGDDTFGTLNERWPFDRKYHAHLIENLEKAGVKQIIFDIEFTERSNTEADELLAKTAGKYDNVIISGKLIKTLYDSSTREQFLMPMTPFIDRGVQWGMVNITAEEDGFVRKYELFQKRKEDIRPSLGALSVANVYGVQNDPAGFQDVGRFFIIGDNNIPKFGSKSTFINYYGPARYFPIIDYADVIDDSTFLTDFEESIESDLNQYYELKDFLKNKIVLVGLTAVEFHDLHHTPFFSQGQQLTPGVEIHANFIEMVLRQDYLREFSFFKYLLIFLLTAFVLFAFNYHLKPSVSFIINIICIIGYIMLAFFIFKNNQMFIPILEIPVLIILTYFTGLVFQYIKTTQERKFIKSAFGKYIAPELVDELVKDPKKLEYGGKEMEITVLFSDIVAFTPYTESHTAKETVDIVREYLTEMVAIIQRNKGTLDKFVGDEIVALYGAPVHMDDHAYWACKTAFEMRVRFNELIEKWKAEKKDPFNIGIGINTGSMIVGNLGSEQIFDYTAIGDNMNAGARIEATTRKYPSDTNILISGSTYEQCKNRIISDFVDEVTVKGKEQKVKIFDLTGIKEEV
jgi:adenylate cyclase